MPAHKRSQLRDSHFDNSALSSRMKEFLIRWLVTTVAVAVAVKLTGMQTEGWVALVAVALVLGIMNAFVRPILMVLSIPFILVTLGFFILILNALMLWLAGGLVPGFAVNGFGNAFFGSIIISVVSWLFSAFFKDGNGRYQSISHHSQMKQVRGRVVE
jgi:putative membrane protein